MNCPICDGVRMREVEKEGIMIDVCPQCKGVWLDRGELEKLMSGVREVRQEFNTWYDERHDRSQHSRRDDDDDHYRDSRHGYEQHSHKKHKKKSVLDVFGDLFD